jgi:hypothetical protein
MPGVTSAFHLGILGVTVKPGILGVTARRGYEMRTEHAKFTHSIDSHNSNNRCCINILYSNATSTIHTVEHALARSFPTVCRLEARQTIIPTHCSASGLALRTHRSVLFG